MTLEDKRKELRNIYQASLISKQEFAKELGGISVSSIDRMRKAGTVKAKKVGGQIRFSIDNVARYLIEEMV